MKLYEISNEYRQALQTLMDADLDQETISASLDALSGELEDKMIATAAVMIESNAVITQMEEAIERMKTRIRAATAKRDWIKGYLMHHMQVTGRKKISTAQFEVSLVRNPPSLKIEDEKKIPAEFLTVIPEQVIPAHSVVNKDALKLRLKALEAQGNAEGVAGCELTYSHRLTVK